LKAQGAFEYLLMIAAGLLFVTMVIVIVNSSIVIGVFSDITNNLGKLASGLAQLWK